MTGSMPGDAAAPASSHPVTAHEARQFIVELANLPDLARLGPSDKVAQRAWARLSKKFTILILSLGPLNQRLTDENGSFRSEIGKHLVIEGAWLGNTYASAANELGRRLRKAWRMPTRDEREKWILAVVIDLAQLYATGTARRMAMAQEPIGRAMVEAFHVADLMRVCLNPECPARYFIAVKRSQKYCTDKCAEYAQREYKLRWWNAHKDEQLRRRRKKRGPHGREATPPRRRKT